MLTSDKGKEIKKERRENEREERWKSACSLKREPPSTDHGLEGAERGREEERDTLLSTYSDDGCLLAGSERGEG